MSHFLPRDETVFLMVDLQTRFAPVIPGFEAIEENARRLLLTAGILELPRMATEQYPQGLGRTVPGLLTELGEIEPIAKRCFSAAGDPNVNAWLVQHAAHSVVLFGVETHVCILQTALDLIETGHVVHVVTDACGSRSPHDRDRAFDRMAAAGAVLTTAETVAFELLRTSEDELFKPLQSLFV